MLGSSTRTIGQIKRLWTSIYFEAKYNGGAQADIVAHLSCLISTEINARTSLIPIGYESVIIRCFELGGVEDACGQVEPYGGLFLT